MGLPKPERVRVWKRRPDILLCPNIPAPMHGLAPRVVLGAKWWDQTRKAAYRSTNYRCQACGVHKYKAKARQWLEGHELYFTDYPKGRLTYLETVPLCHYCHNYIHDGRMLHLLKAGEMSQGKYTSVIQHGNRVLAAAGLQKNTHAEREAAVAIMLETGKIPAWDDWRLVIDGVEYAPLLNEEEWKVKYDRNTGA